MILTAGAFNDTAALKVGTLTLTITVTGHYNNLSTGAGNSYNPFARVTGTINGQGTQLTVVGVNGTTITSVNGTETITIAAGKTASFKVENTGASGSATLRSALETSVNGGHITGSNLSGTGVTAKNLSPLAAGKSSSVFTIAYSGGAPNNQAIHLQSDFANVAGIIIDIVAAPAAASEPAFAAVSTVPSHSGAVEMISAHRFS